MPKKKYYLDEIKIPGIEPSEEWKEYVRLESEGKATAEDARRFMRERFDYTKWQQILFDDRMN